MSGQVAQAQPLERLFYSPEERSTLEALRKGEGVPGQPATGSQVTLNGFVARSGGRTTVWLNRMPQYDGEQPRAVRASIRNAELVVIRLPDSGKSAVLKVGQTLDVATGAVREVYQRDPAAENPATARQAPVSAMDERGAVE